MGKKVWRMGVINTQRDKYMMKEDGGKGDSVC